MFEELRTGVYLLLEAILLENERQSKNTYNQIW